MMEKNTNLTVINLQYCEIGSEGAKFIGSMLEKNSYLTNLDLNSNCIGEEGAKAIGLGLEKNNTLTNPQPKTQKGLTSRHWALT